jgi:hypothetical protein
MVDVGFGVTVGVGVSVTVAVAVGMRGESLPPHATRHDSVKTSVNGVRSLLTPGIRP